MIKEILRLLIGYSAWFFVLGLALWRGGRPERLVALINLAGLVISPIVQDRHFHNHFQLNLTLVDSGVMLGFLLVALRSDRWWPLFNAAAALMTVLTDLAYLTIHMPLRAALTGEVIWSYVAMFALVGGLFEVEARRRRSRRAYSTAPT